MLNEGDKPIAKQDIDQNALRRVQILKHLPLAIAQFDGTGKVMEQNPEASGVFGGSHSVGPTFVERFVDASVGRNLLESILSTDEFCHLDAQLRTATGDAGWFSIKAGQRRDPVTGETVVIYSARDITETVQARLEADRMHLEKSEFL